MEKKNIFAKFGLTWALGVMLIAGGLMVGCKDYDKDITRIDKELEDLRKQIELVTGGKFVTNVTGTADGLLVTFGDGTTSPVKFNGSLVDLTETATGWTLTVNGKSVTIPKNGGVVVGSVTLIPDLVIDGMTPVVPVNFLLVEEAADADDDDVNINGTTTLRFRVSPSNVTRNSFTVGIVTEMIQTYAESDIEVSVKDSEVTLEDGILTVPVHFNGKGAADPDGDFTTKEDCGGR